MDQSALMLESSAPGQTFLVTIRSATKTDLWWRVRVHPRMTISMVRERLARGSGNYANAIYHAEQELPLNATVGDCGIDEDSILTAGRSESALYGTKKKSGAKLGGYEDKSFKRWNFSTRPGSANDLPEFMQSAKSNTAAKSTRSRHGSSTAGPKNNVAGSLGTRFRQTAKAALAAESRAEKLREEVFRDRIYRKIRTPALPLDVHMFSAEAGPARPEFQELLAAAKEEEEELVFGGKKINPLAAVDEEESWRSWYGVQREASPSRLKAINDEADRLSEYGIELAETRTSSPIRSRAATPIDYREQIIEDRLNGSYLGRTFRYPARASTPSFVERARTPATTTGAPPLAGRVRLGERPSSSLSFGSTYY